VKHASWPVIAMAAGLALMVLAPLIVGVLPAGTLAVWSDADQAQLQRRRLIFTPPTTLLRHFAWHICRQSREPFDPVAAKARHAAAKAELDKQQARLHAAQSPHLAPRTLRLLGIVAAAIGVWGYFARATSRDPAEKCTATLPPTLAALKRRQIVKPRDAAPSPADIPPPSR
jgi:hypothetical protein